MSCINAYLKFSFWKIKKKYRNPFDLIYLLIYIYEYILPIYICFIHEYLWSISSCCFFKKNFKTINNDWNLKEMFCAFLKLSGFIFKIFKRRDILDFIDCFNISYILTSYNSKYTSKTKNRSNRIYLIIH